MTSRAPAGKSIREARADNWIGRPQHKRQASSLGVDDAVDCQIAGIQVERTFFRRRPAQASLASHRKSPPGEADLCARQVR